MDPKPPPTPPKDRQRPQRSRHPLARPGLAASGQHSSLNRHEPPTLNEQNQANISRGSNALQDHSAVEALDTSWFQPIRRERSVPAGYHNYGNNLLQTPQVSRKKSFVRPTRERISPGHRQFHYRSHAAQMEEDSARNMGVIPSATGARPQFQTLRRGHSLLEREEGAVLESNVRWIEILRRKSLGSLQAWNSYCLILTFWIPSSLMNACGIRTREQRHAWREKIGFISLVLFLMAAIGFLTFGFTKAVCKTLPVHFHGNTISNDSVVIHGYNYDFTNFRHPATTKVFDGSTNPLLLGGWNLASNDASFLFQKTNQNCYALITRAQNSNITGSGLFVDWYYPCNIHGESGNDFVNITGYETPTNCHVAASTKAMLVNGGTTPVLGQVYYTWEDVRDPSKNMAVYQSTVLNLNLLKWLSRTQVNYPALFDIIKKADGTFNGKDLTMYFSRTNQKQIGRCLQDLATIGFIDSKTIGCVASEIILYISLIFAVGIVAIRFIMAICFQCFSRRFGIFVQDTYIRRMKYSQKFEEWTNDIYRPDQEPFRRARAPTNVETRCPFPLGEVVPQPPVDYEPFNFPLVQTLCLVTVHNESLEMLRFCLDALATTDYPNSHKLIVIVVDGIANGNSIHQYTTTAVVLSMMKDFIVPPEEVEPHSYVAIADGHKRHNMAKVYAGYYRYSRRSAIEKAKQQRVPVVLIAKVGNPLEAKEPNPGNRGKRDSQMILMSLLQKILFDERMVTLEYELFNSIWRVTGVCPDCYELLLCVDADTKVLEDSLTRMVSCMVADEGIVGLCGETRIANEKQTFVTMMQVFEYYISHHLTKAFESMFGGVTCLPGCFTIYRVKAPKGATGFWVPILANPDIVEHFSDNTLDTLHKKSLITLGEDRYLTSLLLKTFPKRKAMFCPKATCLTIVPDNFRALLSQRRRWINSTIHNFVELVLVRDLCGTFCFSMQFIIAMELIGYLVLPATLSYIVYLTIDAIVDRHSQNTASIVLLLIMLGIPNLMIVVASRKIAYLGWMLVYIISLPIWQGIIPLYALWHSDDFSWNQKAPGTPLDQGEKAEEFDASVIVMKRWTEYERERVLRLGMVGS